MKTQFKRKKQLDQPVEAGSGKHSYMSKEVTVCPACKAVFHKEELLSGSGRLIAGVLTDELHRLYEPSVKYGNVYPLIYQATVCPECWFAAMEKDFAGLNEEGSEKALEDKDQRMADVSLIFPNLDFSSQRDLISGAASQYLVLRCYDFFPVSFSPTIKQGIAALRTAWLLEELNNNYPDQHYDWLAVLFKKKAMFSYNEAMHRETAGKESLSGINNFGPDTDKNYLYEGALYLGALLRYKYAFLENLEERIPLLQESKRVVGKVFGVSKSSKSKPGPIMELARALYENLAKELNESDD